MIRQVGHSAGRVRQFRRNRTIVGLAWRVHTASTGWTSMIRAILFDFGQTLADSADGFRQAESDAEAKIFVDIRCRDWAGFLDAYRRIRQKFSRLPGAPRRAAWEEVYRRYHCRSDPRVLRDWEVQYWQTVIAGTKLFPEATDVIEPLSERFFLGLVSNTQAETEGVPHRLTYFPELTALFDAVVIAGAAGLPAKPDSTPFRHCLNRIGVAAEHAVHVGDDWYVDIEGSMNAGLRPIWLQHHSVQRRWPSGDGSVPIIRSLTELVDVDRLWARLPAS